jgi:hypothetical protein
MLVRNEDIDFTSPNLVELLTSKEKEMLDQIKGYVLQFQDTIIDHGYTEQINQANTDSIICSVVVSIVSKRMLCLNEFRRGLNVYGLVDIVCLTPKSPTPYLYLVSRLLWMLIMCCH